MVGVMSRVMVWSEKVEVVIEATIVVVVVLVIVLSVVVVGVVVVIVVATAEAVVVVVVAWTQSGETENVGGCCGLGVMGEWWENILAILFTPPNLKNF